MTARILKSLISKSTVMAVTLTFASSTSHADISAIDMAANAMNLQQLKAISEQSVDYEHAYALYRTAITANISSQPRVVNAALNDAQSTLETVLSREDDAESMALLASVYGMQIANDPSKGQSLGMKASDLLAQAEQLSPENPRIALVRAMSAFYTPAQYGGGMDKAEQYATDAIRFYERPCVDICWGQTEAYTWRGLAKQELGRQQEAIVDWQHAVEIAPNYAWANFLLKQQAR
ncbi:tetratricopeptide repeat protein [Shewanella sp. UCD-KL21]|uniref:tetratricopeptide repeat protein n=1 Tax=Shewanella sp. UCD-KL21 TaxID=1917164 RepID=UPI0009706AC6|nr:tetratricopeptide repeat protein [Shewanella sp. UCD-KL21]